MFRVEAGLEVGHLSAAIERLVEQHDALRLRFFRDAQGRMRQRYAGEETGAGLVEEIETDGSRESIEGHAGEVQRSLNIETGPVMQVALLRCGESDRLLVTAHHLVVDGVSWRILLEDLQRLLVEGLEADLGGKTTSYVRWAEHLASYAGSMELEDELAYWEDRPEFVLPRDGDGPNTVADAVSVEEVFGAEETALLLGSVGDTYRASLDELLLTASAAALSHASHSRSPTCSSSRLASCLGANAR